MTDKPARFDGVAIWDSLSAGQQRTIGVFALEYMIAVIGLDRLENAPERLGFSADLRAFKAASDLLCGLLVDELVAAIEDIVPALRHDTLPMPLPSMLGTVCRVCGCSEPDACEGGCTWVEAEACEGGEIWAETGLCSACAGTADHA